jgi:ABC-type nitrate/sulfonate/bicarbonate transport system substrate-binding protein
MANVVRQLRKLRVAGVPEHFNAPFHLAEQRGMFANAGVQFEWNMTPQGTGAMAQKLENGEVDVAVMLSEGAVARAAEGAPFKVVGTYVKSPLRWGIHVKHGSPIQNVEGLKGKVFGVSRMLSGSHLMAHVLAHQRGWDPIQDAPLHIVGTLDGARKAMAAGEIQAWLWEKFTTKHLVDSGEWDITGEIPTPWPCFLFVASERAIAEQSDTIRQMVDVTRGVCEEFKGNEAGATTTYVSERHALSTEDAQEWLDGTEWSCSLDVAHHTLTSTQAALVTIGQLKHAVPCETLIDRSLASLIE